MQSDGEFLYDFKIRSKQNFLLLFLTINIPWNSSKEFNTTVQIRTQSHNLNSILITLTRSQNFCSVCTTSHNTFRQKANSRAECIIKLHLVVLFIVSYATPYRPHFKKFTYSSICLCIQPCIVILYFSGELLLEQGTVTRVYRNGTKLALNNLEDE